MSWQRAQRITKRVLPRVFAIRPGTSIYACARHSYRESGCDFAFTSRYDNYTCGNTRVRAYESRIVVYYVASNEGCGDL